MGEILPGEWLKRSSYAPLLAGLDAPHLRFGHAKLRRDLPTSPGGGPYCSDDGVTKLCSRVSLAAFHPVRMNAGIVSVPMRHSASLYRIGDIVGMRAILDVGGVTARRVVARIMSSDGRPSTVGHAKRDAVSELLFAAKPHSAMRH